MTTLCQMFCPNDLKRGMNSIGSTDCRDETRTAVKDPGGEDTEMEIKEEEVEKL